MVSSDSNSGFITVFDENPEFSCENCSALETLHLTSSNFSNNPKFANLNLSGTSNLTDLIVGLSETSNLRVENILDYLDISIVERISISGKITRDEFIFPASESLNKVSISLTASTNEFKVADFSGLINLDNFGFRATPKVDLLNIKKGKALAQMPFYEDDITYEINPF